MARWHITIRQPSSPTPSPALGTLDLYKWIGGKPDRKEIRHLQAGNLTAANVVKIQGSALTRLYHCTWQIQSVVTEAQCDLYNELLGWQDARYGGGNNGALLLTDEVKYLPPEPSGSHSRTLISGTSVTVASGQVKGFGEFTVKISEAEMALIGHTSPGGNMYLLQFVAVEV